MKSRKLFRSGGALLLLTLSGLLLLPACATTASREIRDPSGLDKRFSLTSYIEEGRLVALVVGTRPTRTRSEADYIPVEVAIVNKGLRNIDLTLESFILVDEDGARYPAVGNEELGRGYDGSVDFDWRLTELVPLVQSRYGYRRVPGTLTASVRQPVTRPMHLPRFSYAVELVYFPRPTSGVRGRLFELFMSARQLEDPVFVRFRVADGKKKS